MRDEIIKYYKVPPANVSVTYNGLSSQMLSADPRKHFAKEKIILAVGTFNKRKNHQNLVSAFLASKIKTEYQLVIIGDKNKVFAESGLDEGVLANTNIKIYEHLSSDELVSMYGRAEILVSLSVYEGFGIPVLEGLYSGCKVICSDIGVYRELYEGYVAYCDPNNVEKISATLEEVALKQNSMASTEVDILLNKYNYSHSAEMIIQKIVHK
jgi:glycosyltransferase involved in cell wall biosynthesis